MGTLAVILTAVAIAIAGAIIWRFFNLRSKGYPVVMREIPAEDARHWRHGVLIYGQTSAKLYKVRSLAPDSDVVLTRLATEIMARRNTTERERQFLEPELHVVQVRHRNSQYEIAVDAAGDTALVAWLESCPSERRVRTTGYRNR